MTKNKNMELLDNAPVKKALIKLGIPTMISMVVSSLYNLVDAYFVGTLGTSQQAAVSAVFPVSLIFLGIGLFFGCGAGSYIARLLGKGDKRSADRCASTSVALSIITASIFVVIMLAFIKPILHLLGCTHTMMPYAKKYYVIFVLGLIINVFNATISNITSSEGAPFYSMRNMLIGCVLNVILDPILISVCGLGVTGAALATLIARIASLIAYIQFIVCKKGSLKYSIKNIHVEKIMIKSVCVIGIPTMLYQFLNCSALGIMDNIASGYGDSAVAACGIVSKIETMGFMIIFGFMKGYQTVTGYNYGAKKYNKIKEATHKSLLWASVFCIIFSSAMIFLRTPIIHLFSKNDADVLSIGSKALIFNGITFLTIGFQIVFSTKFMGLGKGLEGGLVSLGRQGFFFIPAIYIMSAFFGLNGVIFAQPVADILSFILVSFLAYKNIKQEKALIIKADTYKEVIPA